MKYLQKTRQNDTHWYATDGSVIGKRAGWAYLNLKTGKVVMGRTTGDLSAGRGEWLALLHALEDSSEKKDVIILTDYFQATVLEDYAKNANVLSKCKHRDLIAQAAHILRNRPKDSTHICRVKGHAGI